MRPPDHDDLARWFHWAVEHHKLARSMTDPEAQVFLYEISRQFADYANRRVMRAMNGARHDDASLLKGNGDP